MDLSHKIIIGLLVILILLTGPNGQPIMQGIQWLTPRKVFNYGGEENHTLSVNEMPNHAHTTSVGWNGMAAGPTSNGAQYSAGQYATSAVGGGAPHNNIPHFLLWLI